MSAQDDDDLEATLAALQTEIAVVETAIAERAGDVSTPTALPDQGADVEHVDVALNDQFVLLYYYFAPNNGELAVYGEIQNVSAVDAVPPLVGFRFLADDGSSFGEETVDPVARWVRAGERMPFSYYNVLGGAILPGDWDRVEIFADQGFGSVIDNGTSMLSIEDAPIEGPLEPVRGTIRNNGEAPVSGISVYFAVFDEESVFVGACFGLSPSSDAVIPPGRTIRFESGGGSCGNVVTATNFRGSSGPFTQRLILVRYG